MTDVIKPLGTEVALTSANTVANAGVVRIINTGAAAILTFKNAANTTYANLTVGNTNDLIVKKQATDTLTGTATMFAVPVAY